jgi:hypothetical protein
MRNTATITLTTRRRTPLVPKVGFAAMEVDVDVVVTVLVELIVDV